MAPEIERGVPHLSPQQQTDLVWRMWCAWPSSLQQVYETTAAEYQEAYTAGLWYAMKADAEEFVDQAKHIFTAYGDTQFFED